MNVHKGFGNGERDAVERRVGSSPEDSSKYPFEHLPRLLHHFNALGTAPTHGAPPSGCKEGRGALLHGSVSLVAAQDKKHLAQRS